MAAGLRPAAGAVAAEVAAGVGSSATATNGGSHPGGPVPEDVSTRMLPALRDHGERPARRQLALRTALFHSILPAHNSLCCAEAQGEVFLVDERARIPHAFGGSWRRFVEDWCVGAPLALTRLDVSRGLRTLVRLWPARVQELVNGPARGVGVLAPAIDTGLLLADCEQADGFGPVAHRLFGGERSAYAELVLVGFLRRLGYTAHFSAPVGQSVLDAVCTVDGRAVYFEVVSPERSDNSRKRDALFNELTNAIRASVTRCRVEVEVQEAPSLDETSALLDGIRSAPAGIWTDLPPWVRIRRVDEGQQLPPTFDGTGAQFVLGGARDVQDASSAVIARWETDDARAKRIFNQKYRQLSGGVANVLVVHLSAVTGGLREWPDLIAPLLQPGRNTKVGAVVFFDQGVTRPPEGVSRRWRALSNPFAEVPVPESLLEDFLSLDESRQGGKTPETKTSSRRLREYTVQGTLRTFGKHHVPRAAPLSPGDREPRQQ